MIGLLYGKIYGYVFILITQDENVRAQNEDLKTKLLQEKEKFEKLLSEKQDL